MVLWAFTPVHEVAADPPAQWDGGPITPPGTPRSSAKVKLLPGPIPRAEIVSAEAPTRYVIRRDLGGWYEHPELHDVVGYQKDGVLHWTRFYDGIELELGAATTAAGLLHITRFMPELQGPKRPRRDKLIGEKKALELATALQPAKVPKLVKVSPTESVPALGKPSPPTKATLFYLAETGLRRIRGTTSENAMDFMRVVESWRLTYKVEAEHGSVFLDAYTGELVRRVNNWVH